LIEKIARAIVAADQSAPPEKKGDVLESRMRKYMSLIFRLSSCASGNVGTVGAVILLTCGLMAAGSSPVSAFPWSTDMFEGPAVQPLAMAPRMMPDGTLPVDGLHYNVHYGQPQGMPNTKAIPPMKLELMTVRLHNPLGPTRENLAHGKVLFETECAPCHGMTGKGDGSVVHLLQHKPANLLTGVSKNLPDGYVYGYIRNGGIWMPSYDDAMSSAERWQIVLYMRDLERQFGETEAKAGGAHSALSRSENQAEMVISGRNPEQAGPSGESSPAGVVQPGATEAGTAASLGSSQSEFGPSASPSATP
jgi:mono/diheme cytochrome c family protein